MGTDAISQSLTLWLFWYSSSFHLPGFVSLSAPHCLTLSPWLFCSLGMPYFRFFRSADASQYAVGQSVFGGGTIQCIEQDTVYVDSKTPIDLEKIILMDRGAPDTEVPSMEVRPYCWIDSPCMLMDR